jgi:hypothetical protein
MAQYDVCISYSTHNKKEAEELHKALHNEGLTCFLSEKDLEGGDEWEERIRQALWQSAEMCLLVTPESLKSEWVATEWGAAWVLAKRITPVLLRCSLEQLPDRLRKSQSVDFHKVGTFAKQVKRRVSSQESASLGSAR